MANFSIKSAILNSGMDKDEVEMIFVTWKSKPYVYDWLELNNFKYYEMPYDEGKGFLWNLYKGWNAGYEQLFPQVPIVCPIATDHYFYKDWLKNLVKNCKENRIVNCKLVEPGILETLHTAKNYGVTVEGQFRKQEFDTWAEQFVKEHKDELVFDDCIPNDRGTETLIPSGMLWRAMAMAMATPTAGFSKAARNVASPSGKLCRAMAKAVKRPMRSSFSLLIWGVLGWPLCRGARAEAEGCSWGFSFSGMKLSIRPTSKIPAKKKPTLSQIP